MKNQRTYSTGATSDDNVCKTVTVTYMQLEYISKYILKQPEFRYVDTVKFVKNHLYEKYRCDIKLLVKGY